MSRIATTFAQLAVARRKALIPFITAGDPDPGQTLPLMHALVAGGADIIELGVPFSDPMADGPAIQRSSEKALALGVGLSDVLQWVSEFRTTDAQTPVVLMGYANPIERMGGEQFIDRASKAGVDGVIVVDLPPGKRGIFRVFDTADPRRPDGTHPVRVDSVTRDGRPEPWTWNDSAQGTQTIRIGDEDEFIGPGEFVYEIVSRTVGATEPATVGGGRDGEVAWWWDVVGSGWAMPMRSARVTASLPAVPRTVECVQDVDTACQVQRDGASFTLTAGPLDPFTPVIV